MRKESELVAGHEARRSNEVWGMDRLGPKAQMRDRLSARFVGVVNEVALGVEPSILRDNLHGVLVCTDRAISAKPVENGARDRIRLDTESPIHGEAGMGHVIDYADGK